MASRDQLRASQVRSGMSWSASAGSSQCTVPEDSGLLDIAAGNSAGGGIGRSRPDSGLSGLCDQSPIGIRVSPITSPVSIAARMRLLSPGGGSMTFTPRRWPSARVIQ